MFVAKIAFAAGSVLAPQQPPAQPAPIRTLLVTGANNHDWQWTAPVIADVLRETGRFTVTITEQPATDLAKVADLRARGELDLIVLDYNGPRWGEEAERGFLQAVQGGCGVTVVHAANNAFSGWTEYEQLVGLLWRQGTGHGSYHPFDVHVVDHHHAITRGMTDLRMHPDELYHRLVFAEGSRHQVLLSAYSAPETGGTGRFEPMATAGSFGQGRVFHTPLGHVWRGVVQSRATWADPQLRRLVARGSEWAATGAVTLVPEPLNMLSDAEQRDGFELLFDGRRIEQWVAYQSDAPPQQGWVVRDSAIVHEAQGGGRDLVTRDRYADFDFRFSFRVAPQANSGVMWHVQDDAAETYFTGPEFQVIDDAGARPVGKHAVGALYDLVAAKDKTVLPAGSWNDARIVVQNGRLEHWLNGQKVVDVPCRGEQWDALIANSKFRDWPFGKAAQGRIALQDHGDEVAFRNLRIKRL